MTDRAAALAPGGVGNIGPGLDVLGMAVSGPGDRVLVERVPGRGVTVVDAGHPELPTDPEKNTAGIAAMQALAYAGAASVGVRMTIVKGLPLAGGQGGSAASAVAGAVAINRLLGDPLDPLILLTCALEAEATVAGRHADNLAPALFGGVCLIRTVHPLDVIKLPIPESLRVVMAHPAQRLRTADARAVLPQFIERARVIQQMANVAAMVAGFWSGDLALIGRGLDDQIAEPARAPLLRGFVEAKTAAMAAGALGGSISGAGPTSFFLATDDLSAQRIAHAVRDAYAAVEVACDTRVAHIAPVGALGLDDEATSA